MKKNIRTQLTTSLFFLVMFMQSFIVVKGQNASAIWTTTKDEFGITIDGNITAEDIEFVGFSFVTDAIAGVILPVPQSNDFDPNRYIQLEVAPISGYNLHVDEISSILFSQTANLYVQIQYSHSPLFTNPQTVSTFVINTIPLTSYSFPGLDITIPEGESLYIRVYPHDAVILNYLRMRNFSITGNTTIYTPPVSINYSKKKWCIGDETAEVTLTGPGGGTYSSTTGLVIDSSTGSINLAGSLPGSYTISYSVSDEVIATTDISILQLPDCYITGHDGPVCPSSELTFTAPEDMSGYSWSVSENATITGSATAQTVTVTAGALTGDSFILELSIEDENGCNCTCNKEINIEEAGQGMLPTANLSGTQSICVGNNANLLVDLTGQAPWTFTWSDGDQEYTVSKTFNPQHTITVQPTVTTMYSLTGHVTGGNGCSNESAGEATIYIGPVTTAPKIFACPNTSIKVPITVKSFNNVRDISLTLKYDPGVMTYQGFENGGITFDEGEIAVYDDEDFHAIRISKFSGESLPSLEDDSELLRLKFDYIGGDVGLEWIDSPDDSWCSYSYLSAQDQTGYEIEDFCDLPANNYYISGSVKQLSVSGIDVSPITNISTITATPVVIPVTVTYPDLEAQEISPEVLTDARISYDGTGSFPTGARIFMITYNGISVLPTPYNIGNENEVLLSEILGTAANQLLGHSDQTIKWEIYVDGIQSDADVPVTIEALAYADLNGCVVVLDTESFNVTYNNAVLTVTESITACITQPLQFTAEIGYPDISNLSAVVKADAKISAESAFPEGTIINWSYNSNPGVDYILPVSTGEIMLSEIVGTFPSSLQGHTGTDEWSFKISNAGLMTGNNLTIEAVALLEGEAYIYSEDYVSLTVNPLPQVTEVSLLTSTDKSTWTTVTGNLTHGYNACADPAETYHYFDVHELSGSGELSSDFTKNAFYLDVNSVPTGFYDYWNAKGVNASSTNGWQAVMWNIISGDEPVFYISNDDSDYKLIDGLKYQFDDVPESWHIPGDYSAGSYTFNGTVTDVNGCVSEVIAVAFNLSSVPVITCPADIISENDEDECGAAVSFTASASGSPVPSVTYKLSDGTPVEPGDFFPVGITEVTATADNGCRSVTCTFRITVNDTESPVINCPVSGNLDVKLNTTSTYVHDGTEWDPLASDNCLVDDLSYTLTGATSGTGVSLNGTAFNLGETTVTWKATDSATNTDECFFTVTVTGVNLSGTVKYYNTAETPLDDVTVNLKHPVTGAVVKSTTNTDGEYSFANLCPVNYIVEIITLKPMHSINSTDAGQVNAWNVAQLLDGCTPIEKVRFMAGDVSGDNNIVVQDAGMIQAYFLTFGTEVTFDKNWEFWIINEFISVQPPPEKVLQVEIPASVNNSTQNFYGMVSGDFNRSYNPSVYTINSFLLKSAQADAGSVTLLKGETLLFNADDVIELPVRAQSSMQVGAISLILDFPTDRFQVLDVFLKDNPNQPAGFNVLNDMLIIGWNSLNPLSVEAGEPLLTVRLKMIGDDSWVPFFFELVSDPLNELADENMVAIDDASLIIDGVNFKENTTGIVETDNSEMVLACYPNPFDRTATIKYMIPKDGHVNLDITGISGNRITVLPNQFQPAGEYITELNGIDLTPGIYHITLKLTDQNDKQMVKTVTMIKQ